MTSCTAPGADAELAALAADDLYPLNVRATALSLLTNNYPGETAARAVDLALQDEEPLIRRAAVSAVQHPDPRTLARTLAGVLHDPVRTVRIEAASRLAGELTEYLDIPHKERFEEVLEEYRAAMRYNADFSFGRYNLGNLHSSLGETDSAIEEYEAAIRIDSAFYPAKSNLALLYNSKGDNERAEALLREVLEEQPELYEMAYSLGLLLVEMGKPGDALDYLARASAGLPGRSRIHYNLGLLYQQQGDQLRAEQKLAEALALEPRNREFLYGLAVHYINRRLFERAIPLAETLIAVYPQDPVGMEMMNFIRQQMQSGGPG